MAKTAEIKIPDDIEFRVIGNAFGLLIASAGLLVGEMVRQRSFDYWMDDIVPLILLIWMGFGLFRNFISTMMLYQDAPSQRHHPAAGASHIQGERVIAGQIPAKSGFKPSYTPEQVVEQVARRIEAQKAEVLKKTKPKD